MRAFFEALDKAEPWAVFWALVVWLASFAVGYGMIRMAAAEREERYGRRS